jgi:UDP-N-acetylglucosamine--N-acetylmuramyl-(pentapeptide) pyrophosphoryl-undecaprenol N-acetylglucosamine transferase
MRIVIAGGGTGGHLFPGIAIAQEFMERDSHNRVLFVSTGKPFEISVLADAGFTHKRIASEGIKGRNRWQQAMAVSKLPTGILTSVGVLWNFKPDLVVGVGGYSAGPVVAGAWLLRKKIVLQEQNLLPGITNRMLAPFAHRIYISFKKTGDYFNSKNCRFLGNPVRKALYQTNGNRVRAEKAGKPFTVLIVGGSQGAHSINVAIMEAISCIESRQGIRFIHQTGTRDVATVEDAYRRTAVSGTVQAFFMDMASQFQHADLVICRAGATTVAEITAVGKAAIYIPFPHAADNHQVLNAGDLEAAGAAEMILEKNLTGPYLAQRIDHYRSNPDAIDQMAAAAKACGKPDAAEKIVNDCYALVDCK